jgi:formamidopyrimidine-DNA glycosylase
VPELPEVETVRIGLARVLPGKRAEKVVVTGRRSVRRQSPAELVSRLEGRCFKEPDRRGKFLAIPLEDEQVLVVHLRMSGQLIWVAEPSSVPAPKHTHVVVHLDDKSELRFVDPRTFGEWFVTSDVRPDGLPVIFDALGPDPIAESLSTSQLAAVLAKRKSPLKSVLTDQRAIAGIGSIYADEICFAAKVRPDRRADSVPPEEARLLVAKTRSVLRAAVKARGSSLRDASYRDLMGELGGYQASHCVYDRAGEECRRCGGTVERVRFGARTAFCCPSCQA